MIEPKKGQWFRCKACGGYVGIVAEGDGEALLAHSKPSSKLGVPNSVSCAVYNHCDSPDMVRALCAGEPIDPPDKFEPFVH